MPPFLQRLGPDRVRQWLPLATLVLLVALVGLLEPVFLQPTTLLELAAGRMHPTTGKVGILEERDDIARTVRDHRS